MESFNIDDIMKDIDEGLYDSLINEEIAKNDVNISKVGNSTYMDWLLLTLMTKESQSIFSDDSCDDMDNLQLLPSLYMFLTEKFGLEPKEEELNGFTTEYVCFKYRDECIKVSMSYCDDDLLAGAKILTKKPKNLEELIF